MNEFELFGDPIDVIELVCANVRRSSRCWSRSRRTNGSAGNRLRRLVGAGHCRAFAGGRCGPAVARARWARQSRLRDRSSSRFLGRLVRRDRPPESSLGARDATSESRACSASCSRCTGRRRGGCHFLIRSIRTRSAVRSIGLAPSRRRFGWISRASTPSAGCISSTSRSYRQTVADRAALLSSSARHLRAGIAAFAARRVSRRGPGGNAPHHRGVSRPLERPARGRRMALRILHSLPPRRR